MDAAALEKILRPQNPTLERERAAHSSGRWQEYLRERVPPPSRFSFARRRAWQAAYEQALALGSSSEVREALVFDLWYCENHDDIETTAWSRVVAVSFGSSESAESTSPNHDLIEQAALGNCVILARVERVRRSCIMPGRMYGPQMPVPYRNEHYVAVEGRTIERVVAIDRLMDAPAVAKPARAVRAFSTDTEPAIELERLDPEWSQRILRLADALRIFPKAETQ